MAVTRCEISGPEQNHGSLKVDRRGKGQTSSLQSRPSWEEKWEEKYGLPRRMPPYLDAVTDFTPLIGQRQRVRRVPHLVPGNLSNRLNRPRGRMRLQAVSASVGGKRWLARHKSTTGDAGETGQGPTVGTTCAAQELVHRRDAMRVGE